MKNFFKSDLFWYVLLFLSWVLPGFKSEVHTETIFSFLAFVVTIAVLYLVKDKKIRYSLLAVITLAISIYNNSYAFLSLPVLLLISMCLSLKEEKGKSTVFDTFNTIYITLTGIKILYFIFKLVTADFLVHSRILFFFKNSFVVIAVLIYLLLVSFRIKNAKKENTNALRVVYISALAGIILDIFILYAITSVGVVQGAQLYLMYWYIFLLVVFKNENTVIKTAEEKLDKLFSRLF